MSYDSFDTRYPKTQGSFLRDALGSRYTSIGFSFHKGSFNAFGTDDNVIRSHHVDGAKPGGSTAPCPPPAPATSQLPTTAPTGLPTDRPAFPRTALRRLPSLASYIRVASLIWMPTSY